MVARITQFVMYGIVFLPSLLRSQDEYGGRMPGTILRDSIHNNFAAVAFDKSLNTYHWTATSSYNNIFGPLSLQMNEQFLSTIIRTDRKLITDNQAFDLHAAHRLSKHLNATMKVSSFISSDNKSVGIGNAFSHGFYGGVAFSPISGLMIEPLIGLRLDKQLDRRDNGISYLLQVASDSMNYDGYTTRLTGNYQYDKLDPRQLETGNAVFRVGKIFFEQTRNFFLLQYYRNRRDFYSPADSAIQTLYDVAYNIETRADNALTITDTLEYNIGSRLLMTFGGNVLTREINRFSRYRNPADPKGSSPNTSIDELRIEGSARTVYTFSDHLHAGVSVSYLERDEKHELRDDAIFSRIDANLLSENEERKNNHSRRTTIATTLTSIPWQSDTLLLSTSGSVLHYDTPSSRNDDDRDELWYMINLSARHRFNQHLSALLMIDLSLNHLVYLYSTQSSNNTWNRILRLSPRIEYKPFQSFLTVNVFEVLANYTVYDFEYASSSTQSFLFRQFNFIDSTTLVFTKRLGLEWFSTIRLYERGELQWDAFSERLLNSFEEHTFIGTIRYTMTERLLFSIGIRYFNQMRYGHAGQERTIENVLRSIGPTVSVWMNLGERTEVSLKGWYERQSQTGQPDRGFTTMAMLLNIRI